MNDIRFLSDIYLRPAGIGTENSSYDMAKMSTRIL